MTHSFRLHYFHLIWSTKGRVPWIGKEIKKGLYSYLQGIVRKNGGILMEIGGMPDHVHLLIQLASIDRFSYLVRDLKSASCTWIGKQFPSLRDFAWQEGYGSFSVSFSGLHRLREYIRNQEERHATLSFDQEFLRFLEHHGIDYDPRFVLG